METKFAPPSMNPKLRKLFEAVQPLIGEKERRMFSDFARLLIKQEQTFNEEAKRVKEMIEHGARQGKGRFPL